MRLVPILPIPMITEWAPKAGSLFGMHLCLADKVLGSDSYRQAYIDCAARGEYVIIDNGASENGYSVPAANLLEAARAVGAQEIVAPDIIEDSKGTIEATEEFMSEVGAQLQSTNIKVMIVPQGKTGYEWQMCAQTMYQLLKSLGLNKRIVIGVPKHLDNKVDGGRARAIDAISGGWGAPYKFHLLGSGEYFCHDVATARASKVIRSIDTSVPAALAQVNRRIAPGVGRGGLLCDFHKTCNEFLLGLNLLEIKKWNRKLYTCPTALRSHLATPACQSCPLTLRP